MEQGADLPNIAKGQPASVGELLLERRYRACRPWLPGGGVLLDVGCGNGAQTGFLLSHFDTVIGVDLVARHLAAFGRSVAGSPAAGRPWLLGATGERLPLAAGSVDCVTCFAVLEHVPDEQGTLTELVRVLRPGGRLLLSVPNRWWVFETHGADLPLLPWNRVPLVSWWPRFLHDRYARARIYERREIVYKLREHGLNIDTAVYLVAPMDRLGWSPLQRLARATVFAGDTTRCPWLATEVLVAATRPVRVGTS